MKKNIICLILIALLTALICGCSSANKAPQKNDITANQTPSTQITDKENSTDEKEEETNNVQALTPKDFCKKFEGTWTADDGTFVDFAFEEEKPCVLFAIWEAGGYFPGGEIKEVETVSENEYIMTVFFPGAQATDMYDAVESYTESFEVTNHNDGNITVIGSGGEKKYFYDGRMQYPLEY